MDWETDNVGGNSQRAPRLSDLCETVDFRDGKPHTLRPIGPALRVARHWITTKSKEGKKNKPFPKICLGYDAAKGEFSGECPYCEAGIRASIEVHQNVIDRDVQEEGPGKKAGEPTKFEKKEREYLGYSGYFKESIDTKVWTPVRVAVLNSSAAIKVKDSVAFNKVKTKDGTKKTFPPQHPKFGYDLNIQYHDDKKRAASDRYTVVKDERNKLTEEELEYHLWFLGLEKPEKLSAAKEEMKRLQKRLWREDGEEDDDDDDDKPKKKKRHQEEDDDFGDRKSSKSKKRSRDDDEDEDEDDDKPKSKKRSRDWDDEDSDEDEEDEKPKKKSSKSKRRDDDEEDEDDDEDDRPKKKKRSRDEDEDEDDEPKRKKSSKRRSSDDDDEDDEDERPAKKKRSRDDDDDEDEDDEKPRKKRKSRDDDEDEDEDDRPKKKKRSRDDDDEDDDEDDKPKKKSSKKRSLKDEDDSDDWEDDDDDE